MFARLEITVFRFAICLIVGAGMSLAQTSALGIFTNQSSVGQTPAGSTAHYDAATGEYRITGGGANVWGTADAFYFVWKKASGDMTLSADVQWVGASDAEHRKALLMIRQGLDPGSAYADAVSHGNGLTSLQFRGAANEQTYQLPTQVEGTVRLRLERKGSRFTMYAGKPSEELKIVGPVEYVGLQDPVYVGLGVCSHVATTLETAIFSNVKIEEMPAAATAPAPGPLTAEQDHQRIMDLLHITALRRGADGDPKSPNAANYDESKANPYPKLPDPLLTKSGNKVTTAKMWWHDRRPEIVEDFDREIYGRVPRKTPSVRWDVVSTTKEMVGDVPVITKKLTGHVDNSACPQVKVDIDLTLTTPATAPGPVPMMMELGLSPEVLAMLIKRYPEMMRPPAGPTWRQQVLAQGWGYAIYIPTTVQPDNGEGLTQGVIGLVNKGQPRQLDDWGALRAWAWGASRALDYFETDPAVDAKRVGIEGHSRYGKAALVAMANDARFAIAYISSSGEAGAKLFRRNFGEQIGNIAGTGEYHWMAGNFLKYAGPLTENDLPIDAHELIALCAPRPVFIGAGAIAKGDGWVDAKGMFLAAVGAGPVYNLLGKKDLGTTEFPPIETALIGGDIAFRQHSGGHTPAPNWPTFLEFAKRYFSPPPT
ncbi:MAG TPA: hypothetical protein VGM18_01905 [Candidatus Sulfotelmatobacter sp.]|jgi:hypothetical protein